MSTNDGKRKAHNGGLSKEGALREKEEARQVKETGDRIKNNNVLQEARFKTSLGLLIAVFTLFL